MVTFCTTVNMTYEVNSLARYFISAHHYSIYDFLFQADCTPYNFLSNVHFCRISAKYGVQVPEMLTLSVWDTLFVLTQLNIY